MAFLIALPGATLCLHSLCPFRGAQCLQLGKCLAEGKPQHEDLFPISSGELVTG